MSCQGEAERRMINGEGGVDDAVFNKLSDPSPYSAGADVYLFGELIAALSCVFREEFY